MFVIEKVWQRIQCCVASSFTSAEETLTSCNIVINIWVQYVIYHWFQSDNMMVMMIVFTLHMNYLHTYTLCKIAQPQPSHSVGQQKTQPLVMFCQNRRRSQWEVTSDETMLGTETLLACVSSLSVMTVRDLDAVSNKISFIFQLKTEVEIRFFACLEECRTVCHIQSEALDLRNSAGWWWFQMWVCSFGGDAARRKCERWHKSRSLLHNPYPLLTEITGFPGWSH